MKHSAASFDAMFTGSDDPWKFKTRWYESRKRDLTLACLPAARYGSGYEPGCANGELSAALAARCDRLLVSDGSPKAIGLACERLRDVSNVEVRQAWVPKEWPDETQFDLIVISELGYFLDSASLRALAKKACGSLTPGGTVLACHWRHQSDDCQLNGDGVHELLHSELALPRLSTYLDDDMRIDVWCADGRSVATREGFV